jgi:hypothetical protein
MSFRSNPKSKSHITSDIKRLKKYKKGERERERERERQRERDRLSSNEIE